MIVTRSLSISTVASSIKWANLIFFIWSLLITVLYIHYDLHSLNLGSAPFTILGAGITIFLGFRTNTAYDRWWEARGLWGSLVNNSRTLVRQAMMFAPQSNREFVKEIAFLQIAFVNSLRAHLRREDALRAAMPFISDDHRTLLVSQQNVPSHLLWIMGGRCREECEKGSIDSIQLSALDSTLSSLTDALGGCEKIKNTPLPRQYDTVPRIAIALFALFLPLGLVEILGRCTPLITSIIVFLFVAIDSIGSDIEDPFENTVHDTPMTSLCTTIELNLKQLIGENDLPLPIEPVRGILH